MVINRKVLPWLIAGVALGAILLIVLVMVTQASPDSAPHRQGASISPGVVSYQGQVNIGGVPFSGTGYFRFAIVDSGGTFYWSNDSSIITPTEAVTLTVVNGLFNVLLGETNPITYGMFSNSDRWLRVWFDDSIHGVQLLEPDTRITTALFALRADESMTAITSTWSTTATVAITATNATTATFATTALWATQCLSATQWAWYSAFSGNAGTCGTALYALQMTQNSVNFLPVNFARVGGNSWWHGLNPVTESVAPGQVSYWTTDYPFTQTNVLTGSSALTFNESTLSTINLNVSGSFSATVLTATNATTATYATTALMATNATTSTYATTALTATNATTATSALHGVLIPLTTKLTSTDWDGDAKTASTVITLTSAFSGMPANCKAILAIIAFRDETTQVYAYLGPSSSQYSAIGDFTQVANVYKVSSGIIPCDANGNIYFTLSGELDYVEIQIWGYFL